MSASVRTLAALAVAVGLTLAACGSDSDSSSSVATTTLPTATVASTTTLPGAATTTVAAATTTTAAGAPTTTTAPTSDACPTFTEKADLPVKLCDKGDKVREVQQGLVDAGIEVVVDGFFGPQTRAAVQQFQAKEGLEVDGIVGPITFGKLFPT